MLAFCLPRTVFVSYPIAHTHTHDGNEQQCKSSKWWARELREWEWEMDASERVSERIDARCICHRYCKTQNVLLKSELPNAYKTSSLMQMQKQFKRSFLRKFIHVFLLAMWNQTVAARYKWLQMLAPEFRTEPPFRWIPFFKYILHRSRNQPNRTKPTKNQPNRTNATH